MSFISLAIFSSSLLLLCSSFGTVMILFDPQQKAMAQETIPTTNNNFVQYQNPTLGFTVQRPSDWTIEEDNNGVKFFPPPSGLFRDVAAILVFPSQGVTLDQYANHIIDILKTTRTNFQLLGNDHNQANNTTPETVLIHYTYQTKENIGNLFLIRIEAFQALSLSTQGDKVYHFSFVAEPVKYQSYNPIIQSMFNSYHHN